MTGTIRLPGTGALVACGTGDLVGLKRPASGPRISVTFWVTMRSNWVSNMGWLTCMIVSGMVLSPAFLERLMFWRLKSYTGDKPCSTTSTSTHQFAQKTGRYLPFSAIATAYRLLSIWRRLCATLWRASISICAENIQVKLLSHFNNSLFI
jgi:hypothetical protein